jgi:cytochrome P450
MREGKSHVRTPAVAAPTYPFGRDGVNPSSKYKLLRKAGPLAKVMLYDGREAWLVTRYEDVRAILLEPAVSADRERDDYPALNPRRHRKPGPGDFLHRDDPYHARLRRMLAPEFTQRRIAALQPNVQRIVDELIDDLLTGPKPVDLVEAFAYPVPSRAICELLGVPYEDHEFFEQHSQVIASGAVTREQAQASLATLLAYLDGLVTSKERNPADDLLGRMIVEHLNSGAITHDELVGAATILLVAGHETTGNMVALGMLALLAEPERLETLGAEPELIPSAVEEMLRYFSIIESSLRVAKTDFEFNGVLIKEGDAILPGLAIANRDERVFPDPDRLDIKRDARSQIAFGHGVHVCLGAPLARVELQTAYAGVARRLPTMRLAVPPEDLEYKGHMNAFGVARLPVTW